MLKRVVVILLCKILFVKFVLLKQLDFEPRNLICEKYGEYFANVTCLIRTARKKPQSFNFIGILKKPIQQCQVRINFHKGSNRVFPADITFEACKSLQRKNLNPISLRIRDAIKRHSNLNGSCPIQGTVEVLNFAPNLNLLPMFMPRGRFRVNLSLFHDTHQIINIYADFVNNKD